MVFCRGVDDLQWVFLFSVVLRACIMCSFFWSWVILLSCTKFVPANSFSSIFLFKLHAPSPLYLPLYIFAIEETKTWEFLESLNHVILKPKNKNKKNPPGYLKIRFWFARDDVFSAFSRDRASNVLFFILKVRFKIR